jgi:hypothetical protein
MSSRNHLKLLIVEVALLSVSCSIGKSHNSSPRLQVAGSPTPQTAERPSPSPTPPGKPSIHAVDFDDIAYPNFPDFSGSKRKSITLKPGEGGPSHINYGDVTGDELEEAMVVLPIEIHGSAIPYYVYIFTMEEERPKLIWDFETGDRADGGLRQVYSDSGQLVIELFGKDRVIGSQLYKGDEGLCCPSSYTQTRYKWTGRSFQQISKEVLPNPKGNASPVMPLYHKPN